MSEKLISMLINSEDERIAMTIKIRLMLIVSEMIQSNGWSQSDAAKAFKTSQPRISSLVNGKISVFTIDALITMLSAAGVSVDISK